MIRVFRSDGKRRGASGHLWVEAVERRTMMAAVGSDAGGLLTRSPVSPSTPDLTAASDSGSSNTDDITNTTTPAFTGTAAAGATVQILSDGVEVGSGAVSGGSYAVTVSALSEGAHVITARAVDAEGGVSPLSAGLNITIDTLAPAAPSTPDLNVGSDSGLSDTDDVTNITTPAFTGTAEAGSTVQVLSDSTPVGSGQVADGAYDITTAVIADGAHVITATATDVAGNVSGTSDGLTVTIDSIAPIAPAAPDLANASDSGASSIDNLTNVTTPTVAGTGVEAGSTAALLSDGVVVGQGAARGGKFSIATSAFADGTHSIVATATDLAGNVSPASPALFVTIDTSAPAAPSVPDLEAASDTGASNTDNITNAPAAVFVGSAEAGGVVTILSDAVAVGQAQAGEGGQYGITAGPLGDGTHQITALVQDAAGNTSAPSGTVVVVVDSVSPASPSTPDLQPSSDSGSGNSDNVTNVVAPVFAGTAEPGATVTLFADGVSVGQGLADGSGNYQVAAAGLNEGVRALSAQARDAAGNVSAASGALSVTVDRTAPVADVIDVAPDPRNSAVTSVQIAFPEPVTGLTLSSLTLRKNGVVQSLAGASLTGPAADGVSYTLGNLAGLTAGVATYEVKFSAAGSGVADAAGNAAAADASDTWSCTNAAPTNNSLTPAAATDAAGTFRTFTAAYRDANGASDLSLAFLRVNEFIPTMLDCLYDAVANKLFVRSADGLTLLGGFAPGSPNVISNGHGSLDCSQTTAAVAGTTNGTQLLVNWRVACSAPLNGPNVLYLRARDRGTPAALDTGYQRMNAGVWTVTGNAAPAAAAPAPLAAAAAPGVAQGFSVTYADADGWENLQNVYFRANSELPWMLDAIYHVPSNRLYLRNATTGALLGGFAPGSNNVISNGHGSLNCAAVTVSRPSETQLTVDWNLSAGAYLAGPNRLFVRARDAAGADTGYVEHAGAVWTVTGNTAPTLVGVTPASGTNASTTGTSGPFRTLFATYEDGDGVLNLNFVYLSVNANDPSRRLQAVYNLQTNRLFLLADDGVSLAGNVAPGSNTVISNSHGSLNCAGTSISITGNRLTVLWSVSATPALAGANTISLRARDRGGLDTGFQLIPGVTWTIT